MAGDLEFASLGENRRTRGWQVAWQEGNDHYKICSDEKQFEIAKRADVEQECETCR